jgi:hypothetical protein
MAVPQKPLPPARSTDAVERQRAEAKASISITKEPNPAPDAGEERSFKYDDEEYMIPPVGDWPIDVLESIQDDKMIPAVRALLGPVQWGIFKKKPRTNRDFYDLTAELFKEDGGRGE